MMEPRYRFKEFIGIQSKSVEISDICTTTKKTVFPEKTPELTFAEYSMPAYDEGKTPSKVKGSEIHSARIEIDKPVLLINKLNVRKKRIWNVDDPLTNAICSGEFVPLVSNKITLAYLQHLFETEKITSYFVGCSTGTSNSQKRILPEIIYNLTIDLPSKEEQQKIADFLSSYDEKISIQHERVEALERRKKGLLQKVFSQEIRFKADDGSEFPAWTLKALGDIFSFRNGLNASRDSFENGNIPCIGVYDICRCTPITENTIRGYVSVDGNLKESFGVNFGDVLFQRSSETLQDVGHACVYVGKESVVYNGFVIKGTPKKQSQYIPEFIHWMLQSDFVRRQTIAFGAGAQHYNIGQESISSIIGYFPCVEEQKKIGKLFTVIDDQINIEKERLTTMETIKRGLLQGLFC